MEDPGIIEEHLPLITVLLVNNWEGGEFRHIGGHYQSNEKSTWALYIG